MRAVLNRELKAYMTSPIGYVFLGLFMLISGFFFNAFSITGGSSSITPVLDNIAFLFLFITPLLTMRLLSEERNQKTDQILITSPVSIYRVVIGKFLAACLVLFVALLCTTPFLIICAIYGAPPYAEIFTSYVGYFLMGMAYISIGVFVSALTENQAVAAVSSFCILLMVYFFDWLKDTITLPIASTVIGWLSLNGRFSDFTIGVLNISPIVYYICFSAVFVYLAAMVIERRRFK